MTAHLIDLLLLSPLAAVIALYVAWPLLQRRRDAVGSGAGADGEPSDTQRRDAVNRAVVRERRAQLEADLAALPADSPERARLIEEFSDAALQDLAGDGPGGPGSPSPASSPASSPDASRPHALQPDASQPDASHPDASGPHASIRAASPAVGAPPSRPMPSRSAWVTGVVVAALLFATPLLFYGLRGNLDGALASRGQKAQAPAAQQGNGAGTDDGADDAGMTPDQVEELVSQLEARLEQDPSNTEGWMLLGRTRLALGEGRRAIEAFEKALRLDSPDKAMAAQIRTDLADALGRQADANLSGRPWELIQKALKLDGGNLKALGLAGAYQITQGNRQATLTYWEPLLEKLPADAPQREQIAGLVAQLRAGRMPGGMGGGAPADQAEPGGPTSPAPGGTASGPARNDAPAAPGAPATEPGATTAAASVQGTIDVDPAVRTTVDSLASGGATLFVAARRVDADGRPAGPPAAAIRGPVPSTWPLKFALGPAEAMMPSNALKAGDRIIVVVRVSASGSATRSPGDVEGSSEPLVVGQSLEATVRLQHPIP